MIRILTLAAAATVLVAGPASAQTIRIAVAGKSTEQLNAEIAKAATTVCRKATAAETMQLEAYVTCVRVATKDAKAQLAGGSAPKQVAQR